MATSMTAKDNIKPDNSNQNSKVLVLQQTHRSMEQNRKPRNKPTLYDTGGKKIFGEKRVPSISGSG